MRNVKDLPEYAFKLMGSFTLFKQIFFEELTKRPYMISQPVSRESRQIILSRELTLVQRLKTPYLAINIAPGAGKSSELALFVAWCYAQFPDSNHMYVSNTYSLAEKHTHTVKKIIQLPLFRETFHVELRRDSNAKGSFTTTAGGTMAAFGSAGDIVGFDAGLPNVNRYSGCILMDDMHKPSEVHSDVVREKVIRTYFESLLSRRRSPNIPIVGIGQRLHEDDLYSHLEDGKDGHEWKFVKLVTLDDNGNNLCYDVISTEELLIKKETDPYTFFSQYQQNPIPAGGGIFKSEWWVELDIEPKILHTFITADTAETDKSWNDATVFSFWGVYKIQHDGIDTGMLGLHWLHCHECRIEPKDMYSEFMAFYATCMQHPVKPRMAAIEKKSTGVTLCSVLKEMQGLRIMEIERTKASGSKTQRFLETQSYVAEHRITFPKNARHVNTCITHMSKITANDTHAHDDICFVAGTKIATTLGYKNIEDITIKDRIITPFGIGKISACGKSGEYQVIDKIGLRGTEAHPIFTGKGFERLDTISDDVKINTLTLKGLLEWRYKRLCILTARNTLSWGRNGIILANQVQIKNGKILKAFMSRFGNILVGKQYLQGLWFTIRMAITLIIVLKIWSVFRISNIWKNIRYKNNFMVRALKIGKFWEKLFKKPKSGIEVKKEENGIAKILRRLFARQENSRALYAMQNSSQDQYEQNYAVLNVEELLMQKEPATKEQELNKVSVYNLTVEKFGVYYANDILVSNCDTFADAVKLALIDKIIYNVDNEEQSQALSYYEQFTRNRRPPSIKSWN